MEENVSNVLNTVSNSANVGQVDAELLKVNEDISTQYEDYSSPPFNEIDMDKHINISSTNSIGNGLNPIYYWILHWIFSFQGSHRISDNAVVALLSFFATVLKRVAPQLGSLPNTLYTARKAIGLLQPTGCTKFVVCPTLQ
jgi:hypothetical protein